jgi:choline dehydrogenase-like flavoprotein
MDPQNHPDDRFHLSPEQYRAVLALARAMIPPGQKIPGAGPQTITRLMAFIADMGPVGGRILGQALLAFDWAAVGYAGKRLHALDADAQNRLLRRWEESAVLRWPLFLLGNLIKVAHFDSKEAFGAFGVEWPKGGPPEPVRWLSQVQSGEDWADDEELECDAVVVGTGPGGAIVGKELAEQGHAVVFLEEGSLHRRDSFTGSALQATRHFYRGHGTVVAMGNTVVPVLMGRLVGGSTAINTGTSFRTPPWILDEWCERLATDELTTEKLAPHFERVERALDIRPNDDKTIGPMGPLVARGADKLGWSHFKVARNAPDCDGQGCCDWGCPSGGRKSMDVTYIPKALTRGAVLFTETKATQVVVENGRAVGIVGESVTKKKRVRVRARVVVIAGGAVPTPVMLLGQGICNRSGELGKNLSIHPGVPASGLFDELLEVYKYIPQGVGVDQFHRQNLLLTGVGLDINMAPNAFPVYGRRFTEFMDHYDRVATMGVLAKDTTQNGRVRPGVAGAPLITYWLQKEDLHQIREGTYRIMELLFAAGARRCYPLGHRMPVIENLDDLAKYRRREFAASDFVWTVFHPLGTAQMGHDPLRSVVNFDHETHDVKNLFIVDGSTVPGPTAVNPQLTIMAMADRAAGLIAQRL